MQAILFVLCAETLPLAIDTVKVAEQTRAKLMGIHAVLAGSPRLVSPKFSGKDSNGRPLKGHRHVYILPFDENGDGMLDHIVIACREAFDYLEQLALFRFQSLWKPKGLHGVRCVPLTWGTTEELFPASIQFASVTPFVPTHHWHRQRGDPATWLAAEVVRECENHFLPAPVKVRALDRLDTQRVNPIRWPEFQRSRKGDADRTGYGFELQFPRPVSVPVALGYGSHFGLGQFRPVE